MKEAKKTVRGSGRVSFLARLDATKKMIEEGHPLLSIYQEYEKDFGFSYSQFVKYVHKFIRSKPDSDKDHPVTKEAEKEKVTARIKSDPNYVSKALKYDPNSPKEDLT